MSESVFGTSTRPYSTPSVLRIYRVFFMSESVLTGQAHGDTWLVSQFIGFFFMNKSVLSGQAHGDTWLVPQFIVFVSWANLFSGQPHGHTAVSHWIYELIGFFFMSVSVLSGQAHGHVTVGFRFCATGFAYEYRYLVRSNIFVLGKRCGAIKRGRVANPPGVGCRVCVCVYPPSTGGRGRVWGTHLFWCVSTSMLSTRSVLWWDMAWHDVRREILFKEWRDLRWVPYPGFRLISIHARTPKTILPFFSQILDQYFIFFRTRVYSVCAYEYQKYAYVCTVFAMYHNIKRGCVLFVRTACAFFYFFYSNCWRQSEPCFCVCTRCVACLFWEY